MANVLQFIVDIEHLSDSMETLISFFKEAIKYFDTNIDKFIMQIERLNELQSLLDNHFKDLFKLYGMENVLVDSVNILLSELASLNKEAVDLIRYLKT